ncbi:MAG: hypothetical protein IK100_01435 [Muribaculaceae bacterium]|nr:hypothetical protein [Muribaculaceae bacterium]
MKKEDSKILDKLGKDSGFTVPENYFTNFNSQLLDSLPEVKITEEEKPTLWVRLRPFVYMAAMFVGIWLMMNIFTIGQKPSATMQQKEAQIPDGLLIEKNAEDFIDYGGFSDYDMMFYEDSVYMEMEGEMP